MWNTLGALTRRVYTMLSMAILLTTSQGKPTLDCLLGQQRVISYNGSLISPENITATNEDVNINPDDYLFHRNNVPVRLWCSKPLLNEPNSLGDRVTLADLIQEQDLEFHIQVNLTRPVLITQIGSSGFSNGFVNNFTLLYEGRAGNTSIYTQWNLHHEQEFVVPKIDTVFTLDQPFMAVRLKFQINDGVISPSGRLCWHLTLFGCSQEDVITRQPAPSETTMSSITTRLQSRTVTTMSSLTTTHPSRTKTTTSSLTTDLPSYSETTISSPQTTKQQATPSKTTASSLPTTSFPGLSPSLASTLTTIKVVEASSKTTMVPTPSIVVVKDYQVLAIVIPTAVGTILITICIVAAGVCICLRNYGDYGWKNRNGFRSSQILSTSTNTLRIVENGTLYKSSSPFIPLTIAEERGISEAPEGSSKGTKVIKPIYENVSREQLPSKESGYYEPVTPISDDSLQSSESMVDNPTYSVPLPVGTPCPLIGPLPPIPRTRQWRDVGDNVIPMVNNECYRAPDQTDDVEISISQSFSNKLPNDYETPL